MDYKEIDNINDRTNLVLLNHIKNKGRRFKKLEKKLSDKYPDNILYERVIVDRMKSIDLMKVANTEMGVDELGRPYYLHPAELRYDCATRKGIEALKNGLFPSELRKKTVNKRIRRLQAIGIGISAIGGLVTILSFLYEFIKGGIE